MHTKGPWKVHNIDGSFIVASGNPDESDYEGVCQTYNEANARLIAAAPELLEALEFALGTCNDSETRQVITEAIRKAKGE